MIQSARVTGTITPFASLTAIFWASPPSSAAAIGCRSETLGSCTVGTCPRSATTGGAVSIAYVSAGTLTVSAGTKNIVAMPTALGLYSQNEAAGLWSAPGDVVEISAAGDVVPAFSGSLEAPGEITFTAPPKAEMTIPRGQDLVLAWTGAGPGNVQLDFESFAKNAGEESVSLLCRFPLAAGAAVIPAATLAKVPAGTMAFLDGYSISASPEVTAGWNLTLFAETTALDASGASFGGLATFQ